MGRKLAQPSEDALGVMIAAIESQLDEIVDVAAATIFSEIPAYHEADSPQLRRDILRHVREHLEQLLGSLREQRPVTREDLLFIRAHAADRLDRVTVAEFIGAFHIAERILWTRALALADDDRSRAAILGVVIAFAQYFEIATTHAAEVYLEAEQLLATTAERQRRDALEELLAGTGPGPGPRLDILRQAGLDPRSRCLVIAALPAGEPVADEELRGAASALSRALRRAILPLTVLRHDEIVIVSPSPRELPPIVVRMAGVQRRLRERGAVLSIGVSTVHDGLAGVAGAYQEAASARDALGPQGGLAALPGMSAFDYLTARDDGIARRLLPAALRQFVAEDLADGGALLATLAAYAAADLNVKDAAAQLHVHVNTAHYRLARIAERTGLDLRRISDVIELLIAARLAGGGRPR